MPDMKLGDYLSKHELTDAAFAAKVKLSQSQISRLRRGRSMPSWDAIRAISDATGGKVTATDWAKAADAERTTSEPASAA